jgi:hypothetical protein
MFVVRDNDNQGRSPMKFKILVIILALSLASVAQTASPATTPAQNSKACACCNHDKADSGTPANCADCCKDGKCPMMSGSHAGMKCPMMAGKQAGMKCPMMAKDGKMADGKMCCSSNQCPMHAKDGKGGGCCCGNMGEQKPASI